LTAEKAHAAGLINAVVPLEEIDGHIEKIVKLLISSGPEAITQCKELLRNVAEMSLEDAKKYTAEVIAQLRISDEGQEGMNAFLEKRKPKWND
jgi:methylglutaconyl-CoA hydratase